MVMQSHQANALPEHKLKMTSDDVPAHTAMIMYAISTDKGIKATLYQSRWVSSGPRVAAVGNGIERKCRPANTKLKLVQKPVT